MYSRAPSRAWISPSLWSSDIEYPECGAPGACERLHYNSIVLPNKLYTKSLLLKRL